MTDQHANTLPSAPTSGEDDRKHERRWWTLAVLALSLVIIGLDNTILNVALPTLQREFGSSASQLQWMVDAYIIVFAGLLLLFGTLGDKYGRALALTTGLVIFGLSSTAAAYAQSAGQLIAARAVMGIGGAFIMPATLSVIIDVFPRNERGRAIAIWSGVAGLGIGLGPLAGGLLLEYFWWGSVFLLNVPIVLIALAAGYLLVPDSKDPDSNPLDLPGALFSMLGITALIFAIIEAPTRGWLDWMVVTSFVAAFVLILLFALRELRTEYPMVNFGFFRNFRFSLGAAAIAFAFFALFGMVFLLTQYLQFVQGFSPLETGYRLVPIALGIMVGASQSSRWVERFGSNRVITTGMIGLAVALTSMSLWNADTSYWFVGTVMFLIALSMGNIMAPATDAVMGSLPPARAGVGSAMNDLVRQVAGAFGVAIIGSVVNVVYADQMQDVVANLPDRAAGPASDSVGAALQVASQVGGENGLMLAIAARSGFVDALGVAAIIAGAVVLTGAIVVARYLPNESEEMDTPVASAYAVAAASADSD